MKSKIQISLLGLMLCVTLAAILLAASASLLRPAARYTADQVQVLREGLHDSYAELTYRLPLETRYHSPGVNVSRSKNRIEIYFPRVPIKTDLQHVDIESIENPDGSHTINIPLNLSADLPISFVLDGTEDLGKWDKPRTTNQNCGITKR